MVDVDPDEIPLSIEVNHDTWNNLPGIRAGSTRGRSVNLAEGADGALPHRRGDAF